jgi:hypothetical protein
MTTLEGGSVRVVCPWCDTPGQVQLYEDAQVQIAHACPGPWETLSVTPVGDDGMCRTWGLTIDPDGRPLLRYPGETLGTGSDADR